MVVTGKRLVMRYPAGSSFSFGRLRQDSSNDAIYKLAKAFESIQSGNVSRITVMTTHVLV